MLKYLLLALAIIWLLYSPVLRGKRQKQTQVQPRTPTPAATETMVQCAHCGVHLPEGESIKDGHGQPYCNVAHRQAGPRCA
jgi:uncharacterized protein